ncbi:MAG: DMT family transporter [Piscinibacter sp.]|nr:DMT family transporter [Piscinibacter sp.]
MWRRSAGPRGLLVLLVCTWAVSWPAIKVGVAHVPPLWFASLRYAIAASCLGVVVVARGALVLPGRGDWKLIAVSATLQMGAYSALTGVALTVMSPGRASVLAFSTPIWVVPLSAWWLGEALPRAGLVGVALGLAGVLAIAAPSFGSGGGDFAVACGLLLLAAAAWAMSIVYVRGHRFGASALALAPWQMALAALLLLPLAALLEGPLPAIDRPGVAALAYVGPVATAFAYWAVVEAGRHVRASTMSMALLATPCLGLAISAWAFDEPVGAALLLGMALIGAGIRLATRPIDRQADRTSRSAG